MKEFEYIDLGLKSGLMWSDCYISQRLDFSNILHLPDEQFRCYHKFLPTLEDFIELKNSCKIKLFKKGYHDLFIITGPNGNKLRLFKSMYNPVVGNFVPFAYWIKDGFFENIVNFPKVVNISNLIGTSYTKFYTTTSPQWGYLAFVKK